MASPNLFTRDDTFFGVCQGLGEDLGISPDLLRLALAAGLFWNPIAVACAYGVMAAVVIASRLAFPEQTEVVVAPTPAAEREERVELPLAA